MHGEFKSGAQSGISHEKGLEAAKIVLRGAYPEQSTEGIDKLISNLKPGALDALDVVRSSTNTVQRRRYMNRWLREWRIEET